MEGSGLLNRRYEWREELGRGQEGLVVLAYDRLEGRAVALKALRKPEIGAMAALRREFSALAQAAHPAIARVFELGVVEEREGAFEALLPGTPFFTEEWLSGESAATWARAPREERPPFAVARLGVRLALALGHLHQQGLLHGDVSPSNILLAQPGDAEAWGRAAVLVDLGLGERGGGTLPYAAPEALFGEACPASDLYSLGAVLYELLSGRPWLDVSQRSLKDAIDAVMVIVPRELPAEVPRPLSELVLRLLRKAPEARPASAVEVARALARAMGQELQISLGPPRARSRAPLLGRARELATLREEAFGRVVLLRGEAGIGKSRLARAFTEWAGVVAAEGGRSLRRFRGNWSDVLAELCAPLDLPRALFAGGGGPAPAAASARAAFALKTLAREGPMLVHIDTGDGALALALARALAASSEALPYPFTVLIESRESEPCGPPVLDLPVGPLGEADAVAVGAALRGGALSPAEERAVRHATFGNPSLIEAVLWGGEHSLSEAVARRAGALSPLARSLLVALAVVGEAADPLVEAASGTSAPPSLREEAWAELALEGWVERTTRKALRLRDEAHRDALLSAFPGEAREVAGRVCKLPGLTTQALARAFALAGEREQAVLAHEKSARKALQNLDAHAAVREAQRALSLAEGEERRRLSALLAEALARTGDHAGARRQALSALALPGKEPPEALLRSLLAAVASREGRHDEALLAAQRGLASPGLSRDLRALLIAQVAREHLALGQVSEAHAVAGDEPISAETFGEARLLEARGLIRLHLGETQAALSLFQAARRAFAASGDPGSEARALSAIGMARQARSEFKEAAQAFREAIALAGPEGAADLYATATYTLNLGAALQGEGALGEAESAYLQGLRLLEALGEVGALGSALYNYANLCLDMGDVELAEQRGREVLERARSTRDRNLEGFCLILLGDVARSRGQWEQALSEYSASAEIFASLSSPRGELYSTTALARVALEAGRLEEAERALRRVREISPGLRAEAELLELEGLWLLLGPSPDPAGAAEKLLGAATMYGERPERDRQWRALAARARALGSIDPGAARLARAEALSVLALLAAQVPAGRRESFWADAERARLLGEDASPREAQKLARFLEIVKRLNLEDDRGRLLAFILDALIELVGAERGFLLVREGEGGALTVAAARQMSGEDVAREAPSRSIAEEAALSGEAVLTVDAEVDPRFTSARSVVGLRLRSVLAVPLKAHGRVLGCVYLDDRRRRGAFQASDAALTRELGELAAIALENARLREENARRQEKIERLNETLRKRVREQQDELVRVREALKRSDAELRSKYDYANIVGRSSRMRALFALLDRVTDSSVPVLICGESGTGKELVAKAIHYNGPRRERPFVSENCAAIPEGLLESALFGHTRGAFTGADREKKGLFELAHRGSLFLDEVGEMSPRMQARLLRVLQEREVRRVGGDRPIPVDVRIIAATNRDLQKMVRAGEFREDLYFRLAVVRVDLPPLRERVEDVPLLVARFLEKLPGGRRIKVSRLAMARLLAYHWPGNVRELENEITRAALLSDGVIEEEHLSPSLLGAAFPVPPPRPSGEEGSQRRGTLKEQVEALERELLREALLTSGGNRSRAASLLGLSRFGLQKKLRRYDMDN